MLRRAILGGLLAAPALAQTPERALRLIIAFPPGGSTDILGRLIAPRMGEVLSAVVTPENRSGASGAVGAGFVAQAAPDGGTILLDSGGQSVNPFLMRGLGFDYVRDLAPVTLLATLPLILITRAEYGVADLPTLLARLRANPAEARYGSVGVGSRTHLAAASLLRRLYLTGAGGTFDPRGSGACHWPFRASTQPSLSGAADHQRTGLCRVSNGRLAWAFGTRRHTRPCHCPPCRRRQGFGGTAGLDTPAGSAWADSSR